MHRLIVLLICAAPLAAAPVPKALKKKPSLDGTWLVDDCWYNLDKHDRTEWRVWTATGEKLAAYPVNDVDEWRAYIDDKKPYCWRWTITFPDPNDPTAIDMREGEGEKAKVLRGRFVLDGDSLKLCYNVTVTEPRPTVCEPAKTVVYYSFKRVEESKLKAK